MAESLKYEDDDDEPPLKDEFLEWLKDRFVSLVRSKDPDLTLRQLAVLLTCHIAGKLQTVRGLAPVVEIHKPGITRAVDALEAYKLVRRLPDPSDRRSVLIQVTAAGHALCQRLAGTPR